MSAAALANPYPIHRVEHKDMPALCGIATSESNGGYGPAWAGCASSKTNVIYLSHGLQPRVAAGVINTLNAVLLYHHTAYVRFPKDYMFITPAEYRRANPQLFGGTTGSLAN